MRSHPWAGLLLAGSAVAVLVIASGCAIPTKRQWLTFFFDGVPPEKTHSLATAIATTFDGTNVAATRATVASPVLMLHSPYAEGKCIACHESKYSQKMRANLGDSCLECHKELLVAGKSWHAPAASGECVVCHEPHQSNRKFLLTQISGRLCAQCHAAGEMATLAAHQGKEGDDCTTCHDPHQSGNKFLLKPQAALTGGANGGESGREVTVSSGIPGANLPTSATNAVPLPFTTGAAASASNQPDK